MVRNVKILFFLGLSLVCSCIPSIVHNKRSFVLKDDGYYEQYQQLRTDGYYYSIYDRKPITGKRGQGISMKILLSNGYAYNFKNGYGNQCGDSILLACEFKMSEGMLSEYLEASKIYTKKHTIDIWNWGRYKFDGNKILIQTFYNRFGGYYLQEERGEVVDSLSFKILQKKDYRTGITEKVEKIYFFKSYDVRMIYNRIPKNSLFIK